VVVLVVLVDVVVELVVIVVAEVPNPSVTLADTVLEKFANIFVAPGVEPDT
jgi:hypothetical protein